MALSDEPGEAQWEEATRIKQVTFGRVFLTCSGNLIKGCVLVREASRGPVVHESSGVEREAEGRGRLNVSLIMTNPLS